MDENPYLFNILAALLYVIVGARLLALGRRTHGRPEHLLAANYLCSGVSYFLYEVPGLLQMNLEWLLLLARIIYTVGIVPLLLFTRDVFRPGCRWAQGLVWATSLLLFSGVVVSSLEGDVEGVSIDNPWFWCDWLGYTLPYVWICTEALLAWSAARKRLSLGLCDAEIVNRFLLWALFGVLTTLGGVALIPLYMEYDRTQVWPNWGDYVSGGLEAASTAVLWFVFFPPAFYRRWVDRAASPEANSGS